MKPAVLVIDMQNAFCCEEGSMQQLGLDSQLLRAAIPHIQRLLRTAQQHAVPVIYTRYVYRADYSDGGMLVNEVLPKIREVGALRNGTWDVDIIDELRPAAHDIIIDKNRYSAFCNTGLDNRLRDMAVDTLMIAGVTTNMCVESTARDAHMRDYRVWIVREATAEYDLERHEHALRTLGFGFGEVISVAEAEDRLPKQETLAASAKETV